MKQVPACSRRLRCPTAASDPSRGEEQDAAGEAEGPGAFGICPFGVLSWPLCPPGTRAPEGGALEDRKLVFFMLFVKGRSGRWHRTDAGGDRRLDTGVCTWGRLRAWPINLRETQLCAKGWQQAAVPARGCCCLQHEEEG